MLVVAHSMGGLATRFATSGLYAIQPATEIAGIVTIDTPHQGSPFGHQDISRLMEKIKHPQALWPPKAGTDGSVCLAPHDLTVELPELCAVPPYLPLSAPLAQVAGDISIERTLLGRPMYKIDLASDSIVGTASSNGYLESGPKYDRPLQGSKIVSRPIKCSMPLDRVMRVAIDQGLLKKGLEGAFVNFLASLPIGSFTSAFDDEAAFQQLMEGRIGSAVAQLLGAAFVGAPCSHVNILKDETTLDQTAEVLRSYMQKLAAAEASGPGLRPFVGNWGRHRTLLVIDSDATTIETGDLTIRTKVEPRGAQLVGTVTEVKKSPTSGYDIRVGSKVIFKPGPTVEGDASKPDTIVVTYGDGTIELQFCREGVHDPTGMCGA